ncbi:GNAT family N-acetyltransferase [Jannaschia sp. M317]|uniref:GNAT family N-acetyltransferase n=1 Tax=Jannaschia sp. M317 TaxID=2867011 RepID=UPI0021A5899E|nr:GNAT family N-acetyltransferase [Jannaschia sp. M317]UWQ18740.1 GNAT family N-acetyltransferase [Jannaschia sp. M317]
MTAAVPILTTDRVVLRAPTRADFAPFAAVLASDRAVHMGGPYDRAGAWALFGNGLASWMLDGFGAWTLADRRDDRWLGELAIAQPPHFPEPELGWSLAPEAEGRGLAAEAATAALAWARDRLPALVSYVSPGNHRSAALARRLGAQHDAAAPLPAGETADETHVWRHWGPA